MAQKTAAGEYLSLSIQAAKAAGAALTDAQAAAEAGDVPAAQAAASRAAEESVIAEQAWEALEKYRKGIATEKTAKAKTNRDAAADNARLAKDFIKTARRNAKKNEKAAPAVFDQMADAPEAQPVEKPEAVLEGEILDAPPEDAPGMPPALDLDALAIPETRTGFTEIDAQETAVDAVTEAQKAAEAAEHYANAAKGAAEEGNASDARTSAMLASGAANRARRYADVAQGNGHLDADDARGYADMAAEYAAAAKGHRQTAEDVEAARRIPQPDAELAEALAEIDAHADADALAAAEAPQDAPEAPEPAVDAQASPEAVTEPQAGAEDMARAARLDAIARAEAGFPPLPPLPEADRLADARELAGPAIGEQAALHLDPADLAGRLATIAQDAAAAALHWSGRGNADAAAKYAAKAEAAARGATACAEESEPEAGAVAVHSRRAWSWAAAAAKAAGKAAG